MPMAYQFGHVEAYGLLAGKKKKGGNTVSRILAEARREPGSCPHVEDPQEPELVWGVTLEKVGLRVEEWAAQAKDARGHALRKDALCLVAGVVSLPREQMEDWEDFKPRAVKWLRKEYGAALLCVVAHLDEAHPHLHFYVVPEDGQRFDSVHGGHRAQNGLTGDRGNRELSKNEKADIRARGKFAYAAEMRKWQDRLQEDVGRFYGLSRVGPRLKRLTRAEYAAGKAASQAEARRLRELEGREGRITELEEAAETKRLEAQRAADSAREAQAAAEAREAAAKLLEAEARARAAAADRTERATSLSMAKATAMQSEAEDAVKAAKARERAADEAIASAEEREKTAEKRVWGRIKAKILQVFPTWGEALEQMEAALTQAWERMGGRPGAWMDAGSGPGGREGPRRGGNGIDR